MSFASCVPNHFNVSVYCNSICRIFEYLSFAVHDRSLDVLKV